MQNITFDKANALFNEWIRALLQTQKTLTIGGVTFWLDGPDLVYDLPVKAWDAQAVINDLTPLVESLYQTPRGL